MTTPRRRFTMLDAMILVAATAAGCALCRPVWTRTVQDFDGRATRYLYGGSMIAACFLTPLSLALLVFRSRSPRPSNRKLRRQPGLMACLVVMLAWALTGCLAAWEWVREIAPWPQLAGPWRGSPMSLSEAIDFTTTTAGWMVAAAWFALAVARAHRPEPSWIDRAGRIVGAGWIAIAVLTSFLF